MAECKTCRHNYKPKNCEPRCNRMCDGISDYEPQTNADRIRAMSDEELAEFINTKTACDCCSAKHCKSEEHCTVDILQWLKSEVKE